MPEKTTSFEHEAFYQDLMVLLKKHAGHLDALEMLAVASLAVGKLTAMQDHRRLTGPQVMKVVAENLQLGNKQMLYEVAQELLGRPPEG